MKSTLENDTQKRVVWQNTKIRKWIRSKIQSSKYMGFVGNFFSIYQSKPFMNMNLCRFEELLHFNYTGFISFKSTLLQSCNFGRSRTIFLKSSFLQNACGSGVQRERKGWLEKEREDFLSRLRSRSEDDWERVTWNRLLVISRICSEGYKVKALIALIASE